MAGTGGADSRRSALDLALVDVFSDAVSDVVGQPAHRRIAENVANADLHGHLPPDRVGQVHGRQRIASDPEEVVIDADLLDLQHRPQHPEDTGIAFVAGTLDGNWVLHRRGT